MTALLYLIVFSLAYAQISPELKNGKCVENCLKSCPSLVSGTRNFRTFENITRNIDNYCREFQQTIECAENCGNENGKLIRQRLLLDDYICTEKVEEFRVAKDCVQSQETDSIGQCMTACDYPTDSVLNLDILSSTDSAEPTEYLKKLNQKCRSLECTLRCSVRRMNKKCAGSGELLKEVSKKQIMKVMKRFQINQNETSVSGEIAQINLKDISDQCPLFANPDQFDNFFEEEETGAEMPTEVATVEEVITATPENIEIKTLFGEIDESVSTKIFEIAVEQETVPPGTIFDDSLINVSAEGTYVETTEASVPEIPDLTKIEPNNNFKQSEEITKNEDDQQLIPPLKTDKVFETVPEKSDDLQKSTKKNDKGVINSTETTIHISDDEAEKGKNGLEDAVRPTSGTRRYSWNLLILLTVVLPITLLLI